MNDRNRDSLVERFLSGAMSSSEENAFLARYGSDPEVRARIEAEHTMRHGIETEKGALPMPPAGSRDRFLTMLDKTPAAGPALSGHESGGSLRRILMVIATLGVVATLTLMLTRSTGSDRAPTAIPVSTTQLPAPRPDTVRERTLAVDTPTRIPSIAPGTKSTTAGGAGSSVRMSAPGRSGADTSVAATPRAASDSMEVAPDAAMVQTSRQEKAKLPVTIQDPAINTKKPDR